MAHGTIWYGFQSIALRSEQNYLNICVKLIRKPDIRFSKKQAHPAFRCKAISLDVVNMGVGAALFIPRRSLGSKTNDNIFLPTTLSKWGRKS